MMHKQNLCSRCNSCFYGLQTCANCCGQARDVMGREISEQLDYEPASWTVIEHVRLTYKCQHCPTPPSPPPSAPAVLTNPAATVVASPSEIAGVATAEIGATIAQKTIAQRL